MVNRLLPHPLLAAFIVGIWLLLAGPGVGSLLVGIVLAVAIVPLATRFWTERPRFRRPAVLLSLVPRVLWDILAANVTVAWVILTRRNRSLRPTFLVIPLRITDPYATVALASIITLTPGTVSAQLSDDRRTLYVHALDCADADATIADIRRRYEGPLGELLE